MKQTKQLFKKLVALLLAVILLFTSCANTAGSSTQEENSLEISETISQSEPENSNPQNTERIPNILVRNEDDPYVRLLRDPNEWAPEDFIFLLNIPRIEHYGIWGYQNPETHGYTWLDRHLSGVFLYLYGLYKSFAYVYFDDLMHDSTNFYDKPLLAAFFSTELPFCNYEGRSPTAREVFRDFGVGEIRFRIINNVDYSMGVSPPHYSYWFFYVQDGLMYVFDLQMHEDFTRPLTFDEIMELKVGWVYVLLEDNPLIDREGNINTGIIVGR